MDFLFEWIQKGGIVMYPLLLLSLLSWYIILERAMNLRLKNFLPPNLNELKMLIQKGDYESALKVASVVEHPFTKALSVVLDEYLKGRREKGYLIQLMESELAPLVPKVEKNLPLLSTTASVAPLLGLFGTITGLIKVFQAFAISGEEAIQLLARGISEVLVAAATGLGVAIPAFVAYWVYRMVGNGILDRVSEEARQIINYLE
ncbi:MAG: MotA/TolQ/ExbB proton channel family protein [Aquificae bacterium]|nr:MotA/TolQ/ExbB proton channel family protein [Aquificota bacterium]